MELHDYARMLRTHYKAVAVFIVLGLLGGWLLTLVTPKVYAADASGLVKAASGGSAAEEQIGNTLAKSRAVSYLVVATSRETAQRVIDELDLQTTPAALIQHIRATQPTDTVILQIVAKESSPERAQNLADAWVQALAEQIKSIEDPGNKGAGVRLLPQSSAALPTRPVSPDPMRNLALGGLTGALCAFGYSLIRSRFDRRLRDIDRVESEFGVTVAGAVPLNDSLGRDSAGAVPLVVTRKRHAKAAQAAEAIFKIRTNLQYMDIDNPPRIIVVTSPLPGDGKSTIAANLAASLAVAGQNVMLIDGDLRRPTVIHAFGLPRGAGLTDLLTGRATLNDVVQEPLDGVPLMVVGSGNTPPNPSELLGSNTMRHLLQALSKDHLVVVDAPPLLPVTDAAVLTASADGALIVVSAGKTLDTQLAGAINHLRQVNGRILGVVFNKIETTTVGRGYGNYGYYGGYGYYGESGSDRREDRAGFEPLDLKATTAKKRSVNSN